MYPHELCAPSATPTSNDLSIAQGNGEYPSSIPGSVLIEGYEG